MNCLSYCKKDLIEHITETIDIFLKRKNSLRYKMEMWCLCMHLAGFNESVCTTTTFSFSFSVVFVYFQFQPLKYSFHQHTLYPKAVPELQEDHGFINVFFTKHQQWPAPQNHCPLRLLELSNYCRRCYWRLQAAWWYCRHRQWPPYLAWITPHWIRVTIEMIEHFVAFEFRYSDSCKFHL